MSVGLAHPGPVAADRVVAVGTRSRKQMINLAPGRRLVDAIDDAARAAGVHSAQVELLAGMLDPVSYCVPAYATDGCRAVSYSDTVTAEGPVSLLAGAATFGHRDGEPFLHCHALWFDAAGALRAGHLWPATMIGAIPLRVVLHPLPAVQSISAEDPETLMPVFTPHAVGAAPGDGRRVVVSRVLPGEDLHAAAHGICARAGFARGLIRASIGSLVGPTMLGGGRAPAGPCTEIVTILGEVGADSPQHPLHVVAVDSEGEVHGGLLDGPRSPVAVTAELLIIET